MVDVLSMLDKLLEAVEDVNNTIGSSSSNNDDIVNAITVGTSSINSQLVDINIHLGNIETILRLLLSFTVLIITFKSVYFIMDKIFFNSV